MLKYAHVIVPLASISPQLIHPLEKKPLSAIAEKITAGRVDFQSFFLKFDFNNNNNNSKNNNNNNSNNSSSNSSNNNDPFIAEETINKSAKQAKMTGSCRETSANSSKGAERVALVTGASKRIGAAIARCLHRAGFNIVAHYILSGQESSELVKEFNSTRKNSACSIQEDLSTAVHSTADRLIKEAVGVWGRLDVLVNNASIFQPTTVGDINEDVWNKLIQTNLTAPFFLCQAAYPTLKASHGCIVNILDIHALRPLANNSVYCISKAGLHMATLALAKDFAPDVRVNGVAPGAIFWPEEGVAEYDAKKKTATIEKIPMGRIGDANDIASAVEYLVGASYVTGQVMNVDGGRTLSQ